MKGASICGGVRALWRRRSRLRSGVTALILCLLGSIQGAQGVLAASEHAEKRLPPTIVAEATLPMTPAQFKELWMDAAFYERYLKATGEHIVFVDTTY